MLLLHRPCPAPYTPLVCQTAKLRAFFGQHGSSLWEEGRLGKLHSQGPPSAQVLFLHPPLNGELSPSRWRSCCTQEFTVCPRDTLCCPLPVRSLWGSGGLHTSRIIQAEAPRGAFAIRSYIGKGLSQGWLAPLAGSEGAVLTESK